MCTVDEYIKLFRQKTHTDFEVIFKDAETSEEILKCNECGTVIFPDENKSFDPKLQCPTCGKYETNHIFWTHEDIDNDSEKQDYLDNLIALQNENDETEKRIQERGGLQDWQLYKKLVKMPFRRYNIELRVDNINNGLAGLELVIEKMKKMEDKNYPWNDPFYQVYKTTRIPLSFSAMKKNREMKKYMKGKYNTQKALNNA